MQKSGLTESINPGLMESINPIILHEVKWLVPTFSRAQVSFTVAIRYTQSQQSLAKSEHIFLQSFPKVCMCHIYV